MLKDRDLIAQPNMGNCWCMVCLGKATYVYQVGSRWFYLCSYRCGDIFHRSQMQIHGARKRSRMLGHDATLTLNEWFHAIRYFEFKCAYCQQAPYESCDHYIPVSAGGGTTLSNCIPSCIACNASKERFYGEMLAALFSRAAYDRIVIFLADRAVRERQYENY